MPGSSVQPKHLARSTALRHPLGVSLRTPLLVPSFSSKGFLVDGHGRSELHAAFRPLAAFLTDSMLVSAYDINYRRIPSPNALTNIPALTFVDSGGYEIADDHDLSSVLRHPISPEPWDREMLQSILSRWPKRSAAVFVSYDHPQHRVSFENQIDQGRSLFAQYRNQLSCLLIKPERARDRTLDRVFGKVLLNVKELSAFSVVGVTEKELGTSLLDRMVQIARLRLSMTEAGVEVPIHVFGSLDPLSASLYYLAGAEIFDGLTWLRYGFDLDRCVYRSNYGASQVGIEASETKINEQMTTRNVLYLQKLEQRMRNFLLEGDFSKFGENEKLVRDGLDSLRSRLGGKL